jgi:16S rRNA (cytosine1402-N4)-methyltransferase
VRDSQPANPIDEESPRRGRHLPVLLAETLELLAPQPGQTALDCTAGLGGHAEALALSVGPAGAIVLNDADPGNLASSVQRLEALAAPPRMVALQGNFADAPRRLAEARLKAHVALADLGFSSNQVESAERGLSFQREGPLDMRLDPGAPVTAAELVNSLSEQELAEVIRDFGEERQWRRVARKLVDERAASPIETTTRLASIVRSVVGGKGGPGRIDPATRTFQALRIAVNDELGSLRSLLESVGRAAAALAGAGATDRLWLAPGARIGVISFHSLEDRLVKRAFGDLVSRGLAQSVTRKPVEATEQERDTNPRSRSAKLRVIRLTDSSDRRGVV